MVMDHRNPAHTSIKAKFPFLSSSKYHSSFLNLQQHSDKCRALVVCYRVKGLKKTALPTRKPEFISPQNQVQVLQQYLHWKSSCLFKTRQSRIFKQNRNQEFLVCGIFKANQMVRTYVGLQSFETFPLALKFPLAKLSAIFMPMQNDFCFSSNQKSAGIDKLVGKSLCQ